MKWDWIPDHFGLLGTLLGQHSILAFVPRS